MGIYRMKWSIILISCALGSVIFAYAAQTHGIHGANKAASKLNKSLYLIVSPHNPDQCQASHDAVASSGSSGISRWNWGCASGDHTGYALVEAESNVAALMMVPQSLRGQARAIQVDKYTAEVLGQIHAAR